MLDISNDSLIPFKHYYIIVGAPENSPNGRSDFFKGKTGALYNIAGHLFSPDDIEHGKSLSLSLMTDCYFYD